MRRALTVACLAVSLALPCAAVEKFQPADFETTADFQLVVDNSRYLRRGASKIAAKGAYVTLAHGLVPGNSDGLEIVFFEKPVTESELPDLMDNDAKAKKGSGSYAALVLYLDKGNRVSQANLSYVVPGTTVATTVASSPHELKRYFSHLTFRNGRLALKSKGAYSEAAPPQDVFTLKWDIDLDLPVKRRIQR